MYSLLTLAFMMDPELGQSGELGRKQSAHPKSFEDFSVNQGRK